MHIESDRPIGLAEPADIQISVTAADNRHAATPLDYETFQILPEGGIRVKAYDASGASVNLVFSEPLMFELAMGYFLVRSGDGRFIEG